mmetsp:Transcript_51633/g.125957  ORF Transcript_51633/g.125957 Transcript_51633/m.125957 type:complete len:216 (-) Transcript_51633:12-659(-)
MWLRSHISCALKSWNSRDWTLSRLVCRISDSLRMVSDVCLPYPAALDTAALAPALAMMCTKSSGDMPWLMEIPASVNSSSSSSSVGETPPSRFAKHVLASCRSISPSLLMSMILKTEWRCRLSSSSSSTVVGITRRGRNPPPAPVRRGRQGARAADEIPSDTPMPPEIHDACETPPFQALSELPSSWWSDPRLAVFGATYTRLVRLLSATLCKKL